MEFLSKLGEILELAKKHNYKLEREEIIAYFQDDMLTDEQMQLVFDYLLSQKVAVRGYIKVDSSTTEYHEDLKLEETQVYSHEEIEYLKEYTNDLKAIPSCSEVELLELFRLVTKHDVLAKGRITESYLIKVVEIGKEMHHPEVFLGDLIQEGNVGLMLALESIPNVSEVGLAAVEQYLEGEIRQSIQLLIEETIDLKKRDHKMVEQVQDLDENITKLTEELGRKVTVEELALYTELSEAEIMEILKLTGEDMEEEADSNPLGIEVVE